MCTLLEDPKKKCALLKNFHTESAHLCHEHSPGVHVHSVHASAHPVPLMFTSLFDPEVRVPGQWVTATVSRRMVQKPIGGTAGRKRRRLLYECACNEKTLDSKVQYLKEKEPMEEEPAPAPTFVLPEPGMPSSSEDDLQVHTHHALDRMSD